MAAESSLDYPFADMFLNGEIKRESSEENIENFHQISPGDVVVELNGHNYDEPQLKLDFSTDQGFHGFLPVDDNNSLNTFNNDDAFNSQPYTQISQFSESEENTQTDDPSFDEFPTIKKKKGRPKGSKNKSRSLQQSPETVKPIARKNNKSKSPRKPRTPKTPTETQQQKVDPKGKIPKMKSNVHVKKMTEEEVQKYKQSESFIQPVVCYQVATDLDQCTECFKFTRIKTKRYKKGREVDCRFYQFRKLRYNEDKIEVVGFLDPNLDPQDVDRAVWILHENEKSKFRIPSHDSKLMIEYVGDEMCRIIEKETMFKEKYRKDEESIIWKRLLEQVSENCDMCSTTLFNYHLICSICGISLCIDCVETGASEDKTFDIKCTKKNKLLHTFDDLKLTQIIVGDSLEQLHRNLHETCLTWNIQHACNIDLNVDEFMKNLARNTLYEKENNGEILLSRETPQKIVPIDKEKVDIEKFCRESHPPEEFKVEEELELFFKHCEKDSQNIPSIEICQPIRHFTADHRDIIISEPRLMNETLTGHSKVPHSFLCQGKLLRLKDPNHEGNQKMFEDQWKRGLPVLMSNVSETMNRDLWTPQSFSAEFGHLSSDFINCLSGNLVLKRQISEFWEGFEYYHKRIKDSQGTPMLLKLKDWPPDSDFKNVLPSRFEDIMNSLPFGSYTHRQGNLNIVKYLPSSFLHPDLGPKGYFAYGSPFHLKEGTTNLHLDVSDACNVMCYIGIPRDQDVGEYVQQGFKAVLDGGCDRANVMRMLKDGEIPGAIWHIFKAADSEKIRDFLKKIASEQNFKIQPGHDVIHDQNWYLDKSLRSRLYKEYLVQGLAIAQYTGDCIILPAGTPHQVRNIFSCIKVAEDFVSPQQISHCLHLSDEFRMLTKTHTNNEEKINIKNVAYHTVKEATFALKLQLKQKISRIEQFK